MSEQSKKFLKQYALSKRLFNTASFGSRKFFSKLIGLTSARYKFIEDRQFEPAPNRPVVWTQLIAMVFSRI